MASGLLATTGCDAPERGARALAATPTAELRVVSTNISDGAIAAHDTIRVRFDRPLDGASVGLRSVRLERPSGRRVPHVRARADGNLLLISPPPGYSLPLGGPLTLRIEGGGSPRALKAGDDRVLRDHWTTTFDVVSRRRSDLSAPRFVGSAPADGALGVAPGGHLELRFDEPISRASVRASGAVRLRVDGVIHPAGMRLSADLTRLVVRPRRPFPAGARVDVEMGALLHDLAGNALVPQAITFTTRATRLHELAEDFVTADMHDATATTGGWAEVGSPGFLIPRAGRVRWSPADGEAWTESLDARSSHRFQIVFPGDGAPTGVVSGLRLTFRSVLPGERIERAFVEVGVVDLLRADPTFHGNRTAARLSPVVRRDDAIELDAEAAPGEPVTVDVPFEVPVALHAGESVLIDVYLEFTGAPRLAAAPDASGAALVDGRSGLLPAAELLVSGGPPQARSAWFDTALQQPAWREALVEASLPLGAPGFRIHYQTAAATDDGRPDVNRASEWSESLAAAPTLRFVRFRVTFDGLGLPGRMARIDRIVLAYEE